MDRTDSYINKSGQVWSQLHNYMVSTNHHDWNNPDRFYSGTADIRG